MCISPSEGTPRLTQSTAGQSGVLGAAGNSEDARGCLRSRCTSKLSPSLKCLAPWLKWQNLHSGGICRSRFLKLSSSHHASLPDGCAVWHQHWLLQQGLWQCRYNQTCRDQRDGDCPQYTNEQKTNSINKQDVRLGALHLLWETAQGFCH